MANRISTLLDLNGERFIAGVRSVRAQIAETEGVIAKVQVGVTGMFAAFRSSPAAVGVASAAVTSFAAESVAAASNLEESVNAVNVSFGDAADAVHKIGENSVESFGLSQRAFNEFAVQFSSFATTIAAQTGRSVDQVLGDISKRVADFASVFNLQTAEAAQVFMSTLAGETEPIRRFGKDISAAAVEQYALANGLAASKKEMTEAVKVQARYQLLMKETAGTAGDFANTQDSLANQTKTLQANMENLSAAVGATLIPVLSDAASVINELVSKYEELRAKAEEVPGGEGFFDALLDTNLFELPGKSKAAWDDLGRTLGVLPDKIEPVTRAIDNNYESLRRQGEAFQEAEARAERHSNAILNSGHRAKDYEQALTGMGEAFQRDVAEKAEEAEQALADFTEELEASRQAIWDHIDAQRAYESSALATSDAADELADAEADLAALLSEGTVSAEDKAESLEDIADAQRALDVATGRLNAAYASQDRLLRESIATDRDKAEALQDIEDAQRAVESAMLSQREAALNVEDAEDRLQEARKRAKELEKARTGARGERTDEDREAYEDALRDVERAEIALARARLRTRDASRDVEEATEDVTDAQAANEKLLTKGKATDEQKAAAVREIEAAQREVEEATRRVSQAQADHRQLLADSIPTDDEKEAATRRVEDAQRALETALLDQAQRFGDVQGAAEDTSEAFGLQVQKLDELILKYPQLREELAETMELLREASGGLTGAAPNYAIPSGPWPTVAPPNNAIPGGPIPASASPTVQLNFGAGSIQGVRNAQEFMAELQNLINTIGQYQILRLLGLD